MQAIPRFTLLDAEQIHTIHRAFIRILEDTGIQVESRAALEIFGRSDGVKINGNKVCLREDLIHHAIQTAPSDIEIYSKTGAKAFDLGTRQRSETRFGIGVTNTWFQNIEDKSVVLFTREYMDIIKKGEEFIESS